LLLSLTTTATYAVPLIDQNQPNFPGYMAAFIQTDLTQSFQQTHDNIAGAGIRLQAGVGLSDTITISLWDKPPDQSGANMLAFGSGVATADSFFDVFWGPVAITPGTTYFLEFTSLNNTLGIAGDTADPYTSGQVYANPGFGSFPAFDYTFRTFSEPQSSVFDPATLGLLGPGMAGLGFSRRREA